MTTDLSALAAFVFVTTFTPGPNNLASASLAISGGWKMAFPFTAGVFAGFAIVMVAAAMVSAAVLSALPNIQPVLGIAGALYIAWLGIRLLFSAAAASDGAGKLPGFRDGLLLQPMNPKVIVYGLTLYSSFLGSMPRSVPLVTGTAVIFAAASWLSTTTWAAAGALLTTMFSSSLILRTTNGLLALLLFYSAIELAGFSVRTG